MENRSIEAFQQAITTIIDKIQITDEDLKLTRKENFAKAFKEKVIRQIEQENCLALLIEPLTELMANRTANKLSTAELEQIGREVAELSYRNFINSLEDIALPAKILEAWEEARNELTRKIPQVTTKRLLPENKSIIPIATAPLVRTVNKGCNNGNKGWQKGEDGSAYYHDNYRYGNYVVLTITKDIEFALWDEALQVLEKLGPEAALLNIYMTAQAIEQEHPWEDEFVLEGKDVIKDLGWDRRKRLKPHEKLEKLYSTAFALSCIYSTIKWEIMLDEKGKKKPVNLSSSGHVWQIKLYTISQPGLILEEPEVLKRVVIQVRPGIWAEKFLNQPGYEVRNALNQYGFMCKQITKIDPYHDELALRIALHLCVENRINQLGEYKVATLLRIKYSDHDLFEATKPKGDFRKAHEIRCLWTNALARLNELGWQIKADDKTYPDWLRPSWLKSNPESKNEDKRHRNALKHLLAADIQILQPLGIPERLKVIDQGNPKKVVTENNKRKPPVITPERMREARKAKGWSQRQLAGFLGVSQNFIKLVEQGLRDPSPEKAEKIRKLLHINK
jgi:DNA-binding transcriptional regulator YiaG